jgi:hypothetical protein
MLRSLKDLEKYKLSATDGEIGSVANFYLDDLQWTIRYLVAETGGFFEERQVLISPISLGQADWSTRHLHVALTMDAIKTSPSIDLAKPVSRQREHDYHLHYGYRNYWGYSGVWGMDAYPGLLATGKWNDETGERTGSTDDVHLRSVNEVRGYHIQGIDETIGHIDDFIVNDETWQITYLVIDTSNWWFGKKVLVAPRWATSISWEERKINVELSRQAIKDSPEWNADAAVNRDYEARLYDYYGRPAYWGTGSDDKPPPAVAMTTSPEPHRAITPIL